MCTYECVYAVGDNALLLFRCVSSNNRSNDIRNLVKNVVKFSGFRVFRLFPFRWTSSRSSSSYPNTLARPISHLQLRLP